VLITRGPDDYSLVTVPPPDTAPHYDSHVLSTDGHVRFSSLNLNASAPALRPVEDLKHVS